MISQRAKAGFENLLHRCLHASLQTEAHQVWQMQAMTDDITAQHFIMLTVSSYDFRVMMMLHFSYNEISKKYVADSLKLGIAELLTDQYYDFLAEVGNNFCGSFKRELCQYFPHLGMSTPNLLDCESLKYVKSWPIDHEIHIKALAEDNIEFYGSLYVSSFSDLDFDLIAHPQNAAVMETGALELF